jgi:hypothetical protein
VIYFVVPVAVDYTVSEYLGLWARDLAERFRILHYESLPARRSFERGTYVLAALDQLAPGMRRLVEQLHHRLSGEEGFRFLNHPTLTLRRFELLEELRRLNRNEFGAARAAEDLAALRYPVFLRSESSHEGALSPLLRSPREVEGAIGRALVLGRRLRDLLVVEFCETADEDGFYRKYAAFIVGDRVVARSLNYGRQWMLKHHGTEFSRSMVLEERDYVFRNPHGGQLSEIFEVARVRYGRIDYAVKEGRIQTWEINLNPTIGRGLRPPTTHVPGELQPIRQETKEHFYSGFRQAWEAVDLTPDAESAVPVGLDPGTIRAARSAEVQGGRLAKALRTVLRPVKPVLEPRAAPFFRMLGRLARAAGSRQRARR